MKKIILMSLIGMWISFSDPLAAQVSTFPQPPALAPSPEHASDQSKNSLLSPPASADTNASTQGTSSNSGGSSSSSPSPNAASVAATKAAPLTAATLTSMEALDDKNPIEVGDTISFRVIEDRDDAVSRVVSDTGEVDFPYVGLLKVEGKTCHQVAVELKKLLEIDYYKQATVIIGLDVIIGQENVKHDFAWIVGEVREEGPQELSKLQPMTVSQVILKAGGFSDYADQRKVRIIHRSTLSPAPKSGVPPDISNAKEGTTVDVKAVFDGKSSIDPVVQPDDYIIVPKRFVNI